MKLRLKQRLSLQQKILVMVIGASIIIYAFALGYTSLRSRNAALEQAFEYTNTYADRYATEIKYLLEEDLNTVRALSQSVLSYRNMEEKKWKEVFPKMYEEVMIGNPHFLSVWDSWELKNLDPTYKKEFGRYVCEFYREKGVIKTNSSLKSLDGDPAEYARIKKDKIECLENPYLYSYSGNDKDQQLMTSLIAPIMENGNYIGVVGVDISLGQYSPIINQIKPFNGSYAFLIANDLHYISHPNQSKIGADVLEDYENLFSKHSVIDRITNGEPASFSDNDITGTNSFFTFKPIIVGKTNRPWSLAIVVPKSSILSEASRNFIISIIVVFIGLIILSSVIFFASSTYLITPIKDITQTLKKLANGYIGSDLKLNYSQSDEIGQMAEALNVSIYGLSQKTEFAQNIGKGNLDTSLELLSEEDTLGKSLNHMRESLKAAQIEDISRKAEDEKRQWLNEGLAKFSDILRLNNSKIEILASEIIKNLVHYIKANQGGLFIYNDDDPDNIHFELLSAFAFNRHKYIKKQIMPGEGLVGTCAIEKQSIYLTEIPENYIQISSGLGEARPRCLLIVPLLIEDKVLGIIELASFTEIEKYQIDFVEKLAQSIASTLISVRTNIKTTSLLAKTLQQAEEMSAQEEEMRQNMEELQATQEESARKEVEMASIFSALRSSLYLAVLDIEGKIIEINSHFADVFDQPQDNLIGKNIKDLATLGGVGIEEYNNIWRSLNSNQIVSSITQFNFNGKEIWLNQTFAPIQNSEGDLNKVLNIAVDITETKKNETAIKLEREKLKLEEIMFMSLMNIVPDRVTFKDKESVYLRINKAKADGLKLSNPNEVIGKTDFDYFEKSHAEESLRIEKELFVKDQNITEKEKKVLMADGCDHWIENKRVILRNEEGEAFGSLVVTKDITQLKNLSFELDRIKTILSSLSEKIALIVYEIDKDGNIKNITGKGLNYLSKKTDDLIGKPYESVFPEAPNLFKKNKGNLVHFTTKGLSKNQPVEIEHILFVNDNSCGSLYGYGIDSKLT